MFTASPCPAVVATTREALRQMRKHPELRKRLWENASQLYSGLSSLQLTLGPEPGPIVAVSARSRGEGLSVWQQLLEKGVYLNLILPPAAPDGSVLLRCSVSASHTEKQIQKIINAFSEVSESLI